MAKRTKKIAIRGHKRRMPTRAAALDADAAPADDENEDTGAPADDAEGPMADASDGADTGADNGDEADDDTQSETVLVTISKNEDGTYTVYDGDESEGDEDESDQGGEQASSGEDESGEADTGETGDEGSESGAEGEGEPEGKHCTSIGEALKAALDILQKDEDENSGEGSADDNFQAGFAGGSEASPAKPAMPQKY